jgi:hypothetical protein
MANGNKILEFDPIDFVPETTLAASGDNQISSNNLARAISFPSKVDSAANAVGSLSDTASLGIGATVNLLISDDPNNPMPGKFVVIGVNFAPLGVSANYYAPTTAALGTEVTATVLMPAVSGQTLPVSIAVPVADMNGLAANAWAMLRVRRLGTNASDTGGPVGRVLLIGAAVIDHA